MATNNNKNSKFTVRKDGRVQTKIKVVEDGVTKYKPVYGKNDRDLINKLRELEIIKEKGRLFAEIADEWQGEHFKKIENGTKLCYDAALNRAKAKFDNIHITEIQPSEIDDFIHSIANDNYSLTTVRIQKIVLSLIYDYAIRKGDAKTNPIKAIKLPYGLKNKERGLPSEETIEKIKHTTDKEIGLIAYFLYYTGCRRGEALALSWDDIDFKANIITINKTVEYESNKGIIKHKTKTAGSTRKIILLNELKNVLKPIKSKGLIFQGNSGIYTKTEFRKRWEKYCKEIGEKFTPHQLRHAYVTLLYDAGIDAETAMTQTGHVNISTMRNIYTHIKTSKIKEAADKLNKFTKGVNKVSKTL